MQAGASCCPEQGFGGGLKKGPRTLSTQNSHLQFYPKVGQFHRTQLPSL